MIPQLGRNGVHLWSACRAEFSSTSGSNTHSFTGWRYKTSARAAEPWKDRDNKVSMYLWQIAKVQMCAENPREPRENEKLGETCKFSALLNAFLNLHTAHMAEDRNLTGLMYVNIISAQISGWQWNSTGRPKEWRVREISRDTPGCKLPGCRGERDFSSRPCKLTAY